MNTQLKISNTVLPPSQLSEKSNFDINKVSVVKKEIETHKIDTYKKEYENKSHKVSHSLVPTELRSEIDIKEFPLSKKITFWTNYNEQKYNDFLNAKKELFKFAE